MNLYKFPNGIELVSQSNSSSMVSLQCWVKVGSVDELEHEVGMAHFVEHMLFKGTKTRHFSEISGFIESLGGDFNAYTSFGITVYQIEVPASAIDPAFELLEDVVFHSTFPQEEFEKEKIVIVEEIKRSMDSPSFLVGRPIFSNLFADTPAERPVSGTIDDVLKISSSDLKAFYQKWYSPSNMKLVIVGPQSFDDYIFLSQKYFGSVLPRPSPKREMFTQKDLVSPKVIFQVGDFNQTRLEIGFRAPAQSEIDSIIFDVLAFCLGSGDSARLNQNIRDVAGLASTVGASLYSDDFGGVFQVSGFLEPDNILGCIEAIARELSSFEERPLSSSELERVAACIRMEKALRSESTSGMASFLGQSMISCNKQFSEIVFEAALGSLKPADLISVIKRWSGSFCKPVISILAPEGLDLTEELVLSAFRRGFLSDHDIEASIPRVHKPSRNVGLSDRVEVLELKPGLKLVYSHCPGSQLFTMVASTEGGLRSDSGVPGFQNAAAEMIGFGPNSSSYQEFLNLTEGVGGYIEGFSGKDSFGIKSQCLLGDLSDFAHLSAECLINPSFPEAQWEALKRDLLDSIRSEDDSGAGLGSRLLREAVFGSHPYRYNPIGVSHVLQDFKRQELLDKTGSYVSSGPWVVSVVSGAPISEVSDVLCAAFDTLQVEVSPREFSDGLFDHVPGLQKVSKAREQSHVFCGAPGLSWGHEARAALDVLMTTMGGSGGRLFNRLREREGLVYATSPLVSYGFDGGLVGAYSACSPENADYVLEALLGEVSEVCESISQEEVERAKSLILSNHYSDLESSDALAMTLSLMETYGLGYDEFRNYALRLNNVTLERVREIGTALFSQSPSCVVVGP